MIIREKKKKKKINKNDVLDTTTLALIISGSVLGFILILLSLLFIVRYIKKKNQNIDFRKKTDEISNENLIIS